jgi:hypothetical protein
LDCIAIAVGLFIDVDVFPFRAPWHLILPVASLATRLKHNLTRIAVVDVVTPSVCRRRLGPTAPVLTGLRELILDHHAKEARRK